MTVFANTFAPLYNNRLQRLFIILAITAYVLQSATYVAFYIKLSSSAWHLSQYTLLMVDLIVLPVLLLLLFWLVLRKAKPRTERLFKALVWTTVVLSLQMLLSMVYRVWLQRYLPYDGTHWYEPWVVLLPSLVTILVALGGTVLINRSKRISLETYRTAGSLMVLGTYAYSGVFIFRDVLHHYVALPRVFYFGIGALLLGIILFVNYVVTTKEQDSFSTRLYTSTIYAIMGGFIFMILSVVWTIAGQLGVAWMYLSVMGDLMILLGLLMYAGVLFWHKRQSVI